MIIPKNYPPASPQHRLGGLAVEAALLMVTFGIGWFIWSLVVWGQGLTPAKQILKMRVYNDATRVPAKWGQMAIRQFLIPLTLSIALNLAVFVAGGTQTNVSGNGIGAAVGLIYLFIVGLYLTDAFWVLKGTQRKRLLDVIVKTTVKNEAVDPI